MESKTLTVEQAAHELGIGRSLAYELARTGQIPALRLAGRVVIPRVQLEALLRGDGEERHAAKE